MRARIFKPPKNAMQSGRANTKQWVLEYEPASPTRPDPLMGWAGNEDMLSQVQLEFETKEQAIAYAEKHGIEYQVFEPAPMAQKPKAYADNFRYDRKVPWTH
jgi:ETC complex I subunit conserved region